MDIREYTRCIVCRRAQHGVYYLQGANKVQGGPAWSCSPWDAWKTRKIADAFLVARRVGGTVIMFNPVFGKTAELSPETVSVETRRAEARMRAILRKLIH